MRAVNLLPKDALRRRQKRNPLVLGGTVAVVAATGALALGFQAQSGKVHDRRATLEGLQAELAALPPAPKAQAQADESTLLGAKAQRESVVSAALGHRIAWDRVLRELSLVLPDDVWLSGVSAKSPIPLSTTTGGPLTVPSAGGVGADAASVAGGAAPAPRPSAPGLPVGFTLTGYTYSQEAVARLLSRLQVVPDLKNVQLQSSALQRTPGRPIVQFTIVADIRVTGEPS